MFQKFQKDTNFRYIPIVPGEILEICRIVSEKSPRKILRKKYGETTYENNKVFRGKRKTLIISRGFEFQPDVML